MEELIWKMGRQSRDLKEQRTDIRGIWQDDAAREINSRYLDPQETDAQRMQAALQAERAELRKVGNKLSDADNHAKKSIKLAEQVRLTLEMIEREIARVHSNQEAYIEFVAAAEDEMEQADKDIQNANSVC